MKFIIETDREDYVDEISCMVDRMDEIDTHAMEKNPEKLADRFIDTLFDCGDVLNCYEDDEEEGWYSPHLILDKAKEICCNENITDSMLHWLDSVELTVHGISVYGSWLTSKGEALRDYLNKVVEGEEE